MVRKFLDISDITTLASLARNALMETPSICSPASLSSALSFRFFSKDPVLCTKALKAAFANNKMSMFASLLSIKGGKDYILHIGKIFLEALEKEKIAFAAKVLEIRGFDITPYHGARALEMCEDNALVTEGQRKIQEIMLQMPHFRIVFLAQQDEPINPLLNLHPPILAAWVNCAKSILFQR